MGDVYLYPVFFECHGLGTQKEGKLQRYFQVHRRSGGGDCGPVRRETDTVYSVAFKYRQDQQTVLHRPEHVVNFEDGCVAFTVRDSLEPLTCPAANSEPSRDLSAPEHSPETNPASSPLSTGEHFELQCDVHLLRYLKECPRARKEVETELASVSCYARLYPDDGKALFTSSLQPGAIDAAKDWKAEVDKVLDGYRCHYEANLQRANALIESHSSTQTTDGVRVYRKDSMAVVVGKRCQVNAMLMRLDGQSSACEKQTSIHRLGKAKINLLWKELEHSLRQDFPGVKVTQKDGGHVVLEGPGEEILKAGDLISNIENLVLERTAVEEFGSLGGRSLDKIILIDNREEVVMTMKEACDRIFMGESTRREASDLGCHLNSPARERTRAPGVSVQVEILQGTIETQQVDALVSPMVGHDPLSTRVGNTLSKISGTQLLAKFRKEGGEETLHGDTILVEDLPGLPSNAVFFANLTPWDDDQDGVAIQVLRMCINQVLTSCDSRGFGSVAFPVLGAGIALRFPDSVVAQVLLEEVCAFEQERTSRAQLLVRVVVHPSDEKAAEVFKSVQEVFQQKVFTNQVQQPNQARVSATKRIVLLGKTGSGKSNLGNTIFGETLFAANHSPNSGTRRCQAETKYVHGRSVTVIDTPGFFDAGRTEEEMKPEILSCITECAPGPHAFLIVLKVEKFTEHEQAVIAKICQYFSEDALKYAVIVFTHGDQLSKGVKIEDFVRQNEDLSELVQKCGGRCHVIDNEHWKNKVQGNYRSNQLQVEELLNTVDKMVMENNGEFYINEMLKAVEKEIQKEEEHIRQCYGDMPEEEIRKEAKSIVSEKFLTELAGIATGALVGALFGVAAMVGLVLTALQNSASLLKVLKKMPAVGGPAAAAAGGVEVAGLAAVGVAVGVTAAGLTATGGVIGGIIGRKAAEGAETPQEAAARAAKAVAEKAQASLNLHNWKLG